MFPSPGSVDTTEQDVRVRWNVSIPMRDGVRLNAILYLPKDQAAPAAAIFTLTPYTAQRYHDRGLCFAARGYPFLAVDVRGRGNSEGEFRPFIQDAQDGHDVVEWLAKQPYCNGKVAMSGGSYCGYVQWAAAREFPPHLVTIAPFASACIGLDHPQRNNVFVPYVMQWLTYVAGRASQEKVFADQSFWRSKFRWWFQSGMPFKALDDFVGYPSATFQEWIAHPHESDYWDRYNPTSEQYARLALPVLTVTGIYDPDQPGALKHYREHLRHCSAARAEHYLVIGPWDHFVRTPKAEFSGLRVGPAALLDVAELEMQWYAWTMQGAPKPEFLRNNVAYYVMGAEKWRYADTLEAVTARYCPLYFRSSSNPTDVYASGSLIDEPSGGGGPDRYVYDPADVSLAALESTVDPENRVDQRMLHASHGKQLVYHSAPFEKDTEISGIFRLSVWLSIDQPDTDFRVSVHEVDIDGSAVQLTADWMRARYRESFRQETLILTRSALRYEFERFTFVSRRIKKGNRLRLVFGAINSIYAQKNYNSGGVVAEESMQDARQVTVELFHDEAHPSALYVPFGRPED